MGLWYQGFFNYFEINPKTVLTWKREGIPIQEIHRKIEDSTIHDFLNIKTFSIHHKSLQQRSCLIYEGLVLLVLTLNPYKGKLHVKASMKLGNKYG